MILNDTTTIEDIKDYLKKNKYTNEIITYLIANGTGTYLNIKDIDGDTPLIISSENSKTTSSEDIVRKLIDLGANVNIQNEDGYSALMLSSMNSNNTSTENNVKMLIDAGANLDDKEGEEGNTALIFSVLNSDTTSTENTVKMLIDAGANLDIQNNYKYNALILAAMNSNSSSSENTVKMLIDAGANLDIQGEDGLTALIMAVMNSNSSSSENTVKMLIDAGANLDIQNDEGNTALIISVMNSNENIVKMLIDAGANRYLKNNDGDDALSIAIKNNASNIIDLLDPNKKLLEQKIRVNITKTAKILDLIELSEEDVNIEDYIEQDKDNIVIVYNKNSYYLTKRSIINKQIKDALIYPCLKPNTLRPENILRNKPLYDLKKIGFVYGYPCVINIFLNNPDSQLFALINTNETYPSFVSHDVLNGGTMVSALHCQSGQESKISYMITSIPSTKDNPDSVQMGGYVEQNIALIKKKINNKKRKKTIKKRKNIKKKNTIKKLRKH
jgi:ankyrin repeat protein